MSVVAISDTVGSLGGDIARAAAAALGYELVDREIIAEAADRFGESVSRLTHATEERPTMWERFTETQHRYLAYVEATIFAMAARDNVIIVGRSATVILREAPHTARVRVDAPEAVRIEREQQRHGLALEAARAHVQRTDRERASRVRFLYQVDVADGLLYDLVLNTERVGTDRAARLILETLADDRFRASDGSRAVMRDLALAAQARAALLAHPVTRPLRLFVDCAAGAISLGGRADAREQAETAAAVAAGIPGVGAVRNEIVAPLAAVVIDEEPSHGQFRHGEERSWGGHGGGRDEAGDTARPERRAS
jgi:cytidylate kinase